MAHTWGHCDWFLAHQVDQSNHLILMQWWSGHRPAKGDLLVGTVQPLEFCQLTTTEGDEMKVDVEAYDLDVIRALDLLAERCRYDEPP